jgi:hypothetical protein
VPRNFAQIPYLQKSHQMPEILTQHFRKHSFCIVSTRFYSVFVNILIYSKPFQAQLTPRLFFCFLYFVFYFIQLKAFDSNCQTHCCCFTCVRIILSIEKKNQLLTQFHPYTMTWNYSYIYIIQNIIYELNLNGILPKGSVRDSRNNYINADLTTPQQQYVPMSNRLSSSFKNLSSKNSFENDSITNQRDTSLDKTANEKHQNENFGASKRQNSRPPSVLDNYPGISDKFGTLLNSLMLNGAGGRKAEDVQMPSVTQLMSTQMENLLALATSGKHDEYSTSHPLFVRGACKWPGCDMTFDDFSGFTK